MTRPIYESENDKSAEALVISDLEAVTGTKSHKLPMSCAIDYVMTDATSGHVRAWVEVKVRSARKSAFSTFFISLKKILAGLALAGSTGKPFFLAVRWSDAGTHILKVASLDGVMIGAGGRADREDAYDIEPMCHFPVSDFQPVGQSGGGG